MLAGKTSTHIEIKKVKDYGLKVLCQQVDKRWGKMIGLHYQLDLEPPRKSVSQGLSILGWPVGMSCGGGDCLN